MRRSAPVILCAVATAIFLSWNPLPPGGSPFGSSTSLAQVEWKAEFDAVCSKTDVAMSLSMGELKDMIARCVQVKARIEEQEESSRKVYLRRLQMFSDLYNYVLGAKERDR